MGVVEKSSWCNWSPPLPCSPHLVGWFAMTETRDAEFSVLLGIALFGQRSESKSDRQLSTPRITYLSCIKQTTLPQRDQVGVTLVSYQVQPLEYIRL